MIPCIVCFCTGLLPMVVTDPAWKYGEPVPHPDGTKKPYKYINLSRPVNHQLMGYGVIQFDDYMWWLFCSYMVSEYPDVVDAAPVSC